MASDSESDAESVGSTESDKELQVAFSSGLLKPGINLEVAPPKTFIHNAEGLKMVLGDLKKQLPWVERLDLTVEPVPAAKVMKLHEEAESVEEVHDDFKREMLFYRQAQAAVFQGLPRLQGLGIPTRRPEDYFAEMAKSDVHMKKVREKLLSKKMSIERTEKIRKLRELRKYGKKVQTEVIQQRQKDKKELMESIKKHRKGKGSGKLDFLEDSFKPGNKQKDKATNQPNVKRQHKNQKYGFGGQKKRSKQNTAKSSKEMSGFNSRLNSNAKKGKGRGQGKNARPGKKRRQSAKGKKGGR